LARGPGDPGTGRKGAPLPPSPRRRAGETREEPARPALDFRALLAANPFVSAPLDSYSDWPWRTVCRMQGAGLCFSEMIPAIAMCYEAKDSLRRVRVRPDDHPIVVQVEGADPGHMAQAAARAEKEGADAVDVNAGCPSRRVTNGGAGSALLSDLPKLETILKAVRAAVSVPVTLKVRSGSAAGNLVLEEVARMVDDCGISLLTLHPRTRSQGFKGFADWSHIARLKGMVSVPLVGNGDVTAPGDGLRMLQATGCEGVMVGRAAIGNPWIFRNLLAAWRGEPTPPPPTRSEWLAVVTRHFDLLSEDLEGDDKVAAKMFRKHLSRYSRGMRGATNLRRRLPEVTSRGTMMAALHALLEDEERLPPLAGPLPDDDIPMEEP
jgi:tRNA-dihydrouridine synthase B